MDKVICVEVSHADISSGRANNTDECPVALGLKRATGSEFVTVNEAGCWWLVGGTI
jgi:hypothetical protein